MTSVTISIVTVDNSAALDLMALDISPTDFKDHANTELDVSNNRLGVTEAVNMVGIPIMWPLPPIYLEMRMASENTPSR